MSQGSLRDYLRDGSVTKHPKPILFSSQMHKETAQQGAIFSVDQSRKRVAFPSGANRNGSDDNIALWFSYEKMLQKINTFQQHKG